MDYQAHAELISRLETLAIRLDKLLNRLETATVPPMSFCQNHLSETPGATGIMSEMLIPIRDIPKHLPKTNGAPTNHRTIYRWMKEGKRGQKLETVMLGSRRCTSMQALHRFFAAVTEAK